MHDPMVVAWEIPLPIPRKKWKVHKGAPRWTLTVRRRTNDENRGERVYHWWRLKGYNLHIAGYLIGLRTLATIWHVEPRGHDSGDICKHYIRGDAFKAIPRWRLRFDPFLKAPDGKTWAADLRWKYHVWHWKVQLPWLQEFSRRRWQRCERCGGKSHRDHPVNVSHSWDGLKRKFRKSTPGLFHRECSLIIQFERTIATDAEALVELFHLARTLLDLSEEELIAKLHQEKPGPGFTDRHHRRDRILKALGWEFDQKHHEQHLADDDAPYQLVNVDGRTTRPHDLLKGAS